jgi:P27 family predicted phage terminase small subunit
MPRGKKPGDQYMKFIRGGRVTKPLQHCGLHVVLLTAPDWLRDDARVIFGEIAQRLFDRNVSTAADLDVVCLLATVKADARAIDRKIQTDGLVVISPQASKFAHPLMPERSRLRTLELRLMAECGLTPNSKNQIAMAESIEEHDTLARFIRRGRPGDATDRA